MVNASQHYHNVNKENHQETEQVKTTCFVNIDIGCLFELFALISKVGRSSFLINVQSKSLYMKLFHIV